MRRTKFRNGRVTRIRDVPVTGRVLLWLVGVVIVGIFLPLTGWTAVVVLFARMGFKGARLSGVTKPDGFELTDPNDHRRNLCYEPIAYAGDPDPRADDS
jgi:hypothetical protein